MALTVRGLSRELRDLQHQLNTVESEYNNKIRQIENAYRRDVERLKRERDEMLARLQRTITAENREILQRQMRALEAKMAQRLRELEREKEEYISRCNRLTQQIEQKNRELEQEINRQIEQRKLENEEKEQFAKDLLDEARDIETEMLGLPINRLCEDEFEPIREQLVKAKQSIQNKFFEASMSLAAGAITKLHDLRARFNQQLTQWETYFLDWSKLVEAAYVQLETISSQQIQTKKELLIMNPVEWDFWTEGAYSELKETLSEAYDTIQKIREDGYYEYLKSENYLKTDDLQKKRSDALAYDAMVQNTTQKGIAELKSSDDRLFLAEQILQDYSHNHHYWKRDDLLNGFSAPDKRTANTEWFRRYWDEMSDTPEPIKDYFAQTDNPLQYYELNLTYRGGDLLTVRIVPERLDGIPQRNVILTYISMKGFCDPIIMGSLLQTNQGRIFSLCETLGPGLCCSIRIDPLSNNLLTMKKDAERKTEEYQIGQKTLKRTLNIFD